MDTGNQARPNSFFLHRAMRALHRPAVRQMAKESQRVAYIELFILAELIVSLSWQEEEHGIGARMEHICHLTLPGMPSILDTTFRACPSIGFDRLFSCLCHACQTKGGTKGDSSIETSFEGLDVRPMPSSWREGGSAERAAAGKKQTNRVHFGTCGTFK